MTAEERGAYLKRKNRWVTFLVTGNSYFRFLCRDNAALTRKRQRIYAEFLDRTIESLSEELRGERDFVVRHGIEDLVVPKPKSRRNSSD